MSAEAESLRHHIGDVIAGKYRLTEALGEGGMGEVWEGVNMVLGAPVAIKLMKPEVSDDVLRKRLVREARTAAGLDHPAIIRVFDVGETSDGEPYVVMERLHGRSLRELIDDGMLPDLVEVVQALLPVLDALSFAHSRGLVHRDVKPDNVILAEVGPDRLQPKLLDFGVVKTQAMQRYLTHTGTVVGSPPYMSPEQARGDDDIDHLADIWAVCVMLYEAMAGALPFNGPNYHALLRKIVEQEPEPLPSSSPGSFALAAIIEKGLTKDREQRWQTAEELGRALAEWLMQLGVGEDLTGRRLSGRWTAAGRKSVAERRRASIAELSTNDRLEAAKAIDSARSRRRSDNIPTLAGTVDSSPQQRQKVLFIAAGVAALLLVSGLGVWATRSSDRTADAEPAGASEAPLASVAPPPVAEEPKPSRSADVPAAERSENGSTEVVNEKRSVSDAPKKSAPTSQREAAPSRKKPPVARPTPVPAKAAPRAPTPNLGLKDPY
jgi:serine/threonine-protein kinase